MAHMQLKFQNPCFPYPWCMATLKWKQWKFDLRLWCYDIVKLENWYCSSDTKGHETNLNCTLLNHNPVNHINTALEKLLHAHICRILLYEGQLLMAQPQKHWTWNLQCISITIKSTTLVWSYWSQTKLLVQCKHMLHHKKVQLLELFFLLHLSIQKENV